MKKAKSICLSVICFALLFAGMIFCQPEQAKASSKALNLEQIEQTFAQAIKQKKQTVTFTAPSNYTTAQIRNALNEAAKSQNRMLAGSVRFQKQTNSASANAKYTIELSEDAFIKIKRLNSEAAAHCHFGCRRGRHTDVHHIEAHATERGRYEIIHHRT